VVVVGPGGRRWWREWEWEWNQAEQIQVWIGFAPRRGTGGNTAHTIPHMPPRAPIAHACAL